MNLLPDFVRPQFCRPSPRKSPEATMGSFLLCFNSDRHTHTLRLSPLFALPSLVPPGPPSCLVFPLWPLVPWKRNKEFSQPVLSQPSQLCFSVWALSAASGHLSVLTRLPFSLPRWLSQKAAMLISFSPGLCSPPSCQVLWLLLPWE